MSMAVSCSPPQKKRFYGIGHRRLTDRVEYDLEAALNGHKLTGSVVWKADSHFVVSVEAVSSDAESVVIKGEIKPAVSYASLVIDVNNHRRFELTSKADLLTIEAQKICDKFGFKFSYNVEVEEDSLNR